MTRLIDADKLKEQFKDRSLEDFTHLHFIDAIDNAPTVETTKAEHKAYNEGFKDGVDQGIKLSERPQGELINHRNDCGHNIADCSKCGKATQWHDEDEDGIPRYCWFCGARMEN